jgi:hypothetical protein
VLKFAAVAVDVAILVKIDNVFPKQNHGCPKNPPSSPGYSGPEVDFREIATHVREARLNEALAADAFACSVSAVCLSADKVGS